MYQGAGARDKMYMEDVHTEEYSKRVAKIW